MLKRLVVALAGAGALVWAAPLAAQTPGPLTFQQALELAITRNLEIAAARHQRAIREADIQIAGQRPNPDVAFDATQDVPHYSVMFGLPVEIGGQRGKRLAVAREALPLADYDLKTAIQAVRRDLRLAFYGLLAADDRTKVAQDVVEVARRLHEVTEERFKSGASPQIDVMQADLVLARAQADLDLAQSSRASALADLNAVLNQPPGTSVAIAGSLADAPPPITYDRALAVATTSNLEFATAEREVVVEQRKLDLLHAEKIPTPTFSIGGVFDAPGELRAGWQGGVALGVPLFSRNQGEIAQSQATIQHLRTKRDALQRSLESRLFGAIAKLDAQRRQVETYRTTLVPTATQLATLAEESYRLGRNPLLAVLEVQRALRDTMRDYVQVLLDLQTAIADVEEILGAPIQ